MGGDAAFNLLALNLVKMSNISLNPKPRLLERNPEIRPSAREALAHPWLSASSSPSPVAAVRGRDTLPPQQQTPSSSISSGAVSNGPKAGREAGLFSSSEQEDLFADSLVQRLQRFGTFTTLRRLALSRLAKIISAERPDIVDPLLRYFAHVLVPPDGQQVSCRAVAALLRDGRKFDLAASEVDQLLASFHQTAVSSSGGTNTEGADCETTVIDSCEWIAAMLDWPVIEGMAEWASWTEAVFASLDKEHSGVIRRQDLADAICSTNSGTSAGSGTTSGDVDSDMCPFPDSIPGVLREVGHFEAAGDAQIGIDEFRSVLVDRADVDSLDMFESRRVGQAH